MSNEYEKTNEVIEKILSIKEWGYDFGERRIKVIGVRLLKP